MKHFYTLFIALFFLSGTYLNAQTYNEHDISRLKAFVEQSENGRRNIDILFDGAPEELAKDGSNWVGNITEKDIVRWSNGRLTYISAKYKDLVGMADFSDCTELKEVYLRNNKLTGVNVGGCVKLEMLFICLNQISELNIDNCYNIKQVAGSGNNYTSFDISNRKQLTYLFLPANYTLSSINVKGCTKLNSFVFRRSKVSSIDLSDCVNLTELEVQGNPLKSLDLSKNTKLKSLILKDESPLFSNSPKSLNISGCKQLAPYSFIHTVPELQELNISNCGLNGFDLSKHTSLKKLEAGDQQLAVAEQNVNRGQIKLQVAVNNSVTITPSNNGSLKNDTIIWSNVPSGNGTYSYNFRGTLPEGVSGTPFSGTVSVPWYNSSPVSNMVIDQHSPVIYTNNGALYVQTPTPLSVKIISLTGQVVQYAAPTTNASFPLAKGIYIVQLGNNTAHKVIVR